MKKFILSLVFVFAMASAAVISSPRQTYAVPVVQVGVVQGLVSGSDNNALVGASVSVLCNGITLNTTTDASGFYSVQYANGVCLAGQTATVTASKDGQSASNSGVLQYNGTIGFLQLDVAIIVISVIPEFGLITGAIALATSAGSFYFLKKRKV